MAKILVVSANLPDWSTNSGGKERTLNLIEALNDHDVTFLSFNWNNEFIDNYISKNIRHLQPRIGTSIHKRRQNLINNFVSQNHDAAFELLKDELDYFTKTIKELVKESDLLIVDHYSVSPLVGDIKGIPIIYNSHNAELELAKQIHPENKDLLKIVEKMESRILSQAKEITYCSELDFSHIKNYYDKNIQGAYIPNGTLLQDKINYNNRLRSRDIIFVGSGHPPNKVAAKFLVSIANDLPEFNIIIIGGAGNAIKSSLISNNVQIVGHVDDKTLDKYFKNSFAFINPMREGSGTHLKMMKALSYGIPIISSDVGARGFTNQEKSDAMLIANTKADIIDKLELLKDESLYKEKCQQGRIHANKYDWEVIKKQYADFINICLNKYSKSNKKMQPINKEKILISSIVRNDEQFYVNYYNRLKAMIDTFPEYDFYLSLYENDSTDNTLSLILKQDYSMFKGFSIVNESLGTKFYGSSKDEDRVKNLAIARNKSLTGGNFLDIVDYVLVIDIDVEFKMPAVEKILNFKSVKPDFDVVAATTLRKNVLYDQWATREGPEYDIKIQEKFNEYRLSSYKKYYSVSSGFCFYKAEPFKQGVRWGHINQVTNQPDCEMVVVCQLLGKMGYNNIYMLHEAEMHHNHK